MSEQLEMVQNSIKKLNEFMNEALQNGNMEGYKGALENMQKELEMLKKIQEEPIKEKPSVITVFSLKMAESLCVDYGYFNDLIAIEKDKKKPNHKNYIFKNEGNIEVNLRHLIDEARKSKAEKFKQNKEIDEAIKAVDNEVKTNTDVKEVVSE